MWFVVMIRSADDDRTRRRLSTFMDKEVQDYINEIVSCLKFTEIFKRAHVLEIRRGQSGSTFSAEALNGAQGDFVDLLQSIKEELGLRSPRTRETLTASYGLRLMSGRIGKSPRQMKRTAGSLHSHYAFFLGTQLMNTV